MSPLSSLLSEYISAARKLCNFKNTKFQKVLGITIDNEDTFNQKGMKNLCDKASSQKMH